jgi:hypothetical protein
VQPITAYVRHTCVHVFDSMQTSAPRR